MLLFVINWDLFKPSLVREGGSTESRRMSRRLYFLAVGIIAERLINEDFYARATKTVKGWRILLIHHCVVPLPSQGKANDKSKFEKTSPCGEAFCYFENLLA